MKYVTGTRTGHSTDELLEELRLALSGTQRPLTMRLDEEQIVALRIAIAYTIGELRVTVTGPNDGEDSYANMCSTCRCDPCVCDIDDEDEDEDDENW